jgi:hypothetical protein
MIFERFNDQLGLAHPEVVLSKEIERIQKQRAPARSVPVISLVW